MSIYKDARGNIVATTPEEIDQINNDPAYSNLPKAYIPVKRGPAGPPQGLPPGATLIAPDKTPAGRLPLPPPTAPPPPDAAAQAPLDRQKIEDEANREAGIATSDLGDITAKRKAGIMDLAGILNKNAANQFELSRPQIAEDANAAGVFRSTGYGDALARRQVELQQGVATQLGLAGVAANTAEADALTGISANKLGLYQSGLQREFSLEDYRRQADLAREIGATSAPAVGRGKGSGIIGGAATGAAGGAPFGPAGAGVGAGIGAIGGALGASGK